MNFAPTDDGREPSAKELAHVCCAISPDMQAKVLGVIYSLGELTIRDCFCEEGYGQCEACIAKDAVAKLRSLAYPVVRSLHEGRLSGAERIYFDKWVVENTKSQGLNHGLGLLEVLLSTEKTGPYLTDPPVPAVVSQRDMDVATAVVQWLGTNCGRCFIFECEREIEARRADRAEFDFATRNTFNSFRSKSHTQKAAQEIADRFASTDELRSRLAVEIMRAMEYAVAKSAVTAFEGVQDAD